MGLRFDRYGAQAVIGYEHHQVHEGKMYHVSDVQLLVQIAAPVLYLIRTGADEHLHFAETVDADRGFLYELFREPTVTVLGSEVLTTAQNQENPAPRDFIVYSGSTVTAAGSPMAVDRQGLAAVGQSRQIAKRESGEEWVLNPGTFYLVRLTPLSDDTNFTFKAQVYE